MSQQLLNGLDWYFGWEAAGFNRMDLRQQCDVAPFAQYYLPKLPKWKALGPVWNWITVTTFRGGSHAFISVNTNLLWPDWRKVSSADVLHCFKINQNIMNWAIFSFSRNYYIIVIIFSLSLVMVSPQALSPSTPFLFSNPTGWGSLPSEPGSVEGFFLLKADPHLTPPSPI